jgi:hypothetical protein
MPLLTPTRFRAVGLLVALGLVLFIGVQFIRPTLTHPPVLADLQAPPAVKAILVTACYNCHSNETTLPWFDKIVPAYWLVVDDVNQGREHMNFSDFNGMPTAKQQGYLWESVNQVQLGAMPPRRYTLIHPEAVITPEQLATLKNWLHPADTPSPATAGQRAAADAQYQAWLTGTPPKNVTPTLNGLGFFYDYKTWKPVSTTDRYDNNTFRVILGNDIAQRAIAAGNVHPWPDGAAFAKIAWDQQSDDQGQVRPGEFKQVEFMLKDANKYASTGGWGFGRWKTMDLAPYGKTAAFATECISCHRPLHDNDFVFTLPIKSPPGASDAFNRVAALPADLPHQPLDWNVLTTSIDHARHAMSTLYGNDIAVGHAAARPGYAPGAILALVTWQQQDDRHWFGGRIPGAVQSIEYVTISSTEGNSYESYSGNPLQKVTAADPATAATRVAAILAQRPSVMP